MEIPDRPTFRSKMPLWLTRGSMLLKAAVTLMAALLFSGSASASTSGTDLKWVEDAARGCLRGTTVIVTGATRGIGREVAHKLASVAGAHTILACRNVTACQNTAQHIRKLRYFYEYVSFHVCLVPLTSHTVGVPQPRRLGGVCRAGSSALVERGGIRKNARWPQGLATAN